VGAIDAAAPDTWGTAYEWTSPGIQATVERIRTNYAGKLIMANRGLFYFDSNLKTHSRRISGDRGFIRVEMMIESGYGYDQRNGSFNAGSVSGMGWTIAPTSAATGFEFRVSLAALYLDGTEVFGTNALRLLMQDDRGPETAVETGNPYLLASALPGLLNITVSGSALAISWTGTGILQVSTSLISGTWTNLSNVANPSVLEPTATSQFFRLAQ
jgi:hypothetical protein